MAISKKIFVQTELGQAELFCNNERSVRIQISQQESGNYITLRGVQYHTSLYIQKVETEFGFKEWKVIKESSSLYRVGRGEVSPSARGKIESSLLAFVKSWELTKDGEKLLRETEVQDRLERVIRLTEEEKELESQLSKLKGKIDEAISHWEAAKKEYGID